MKQARLARIDDEIMRETSEIIKHEMKNPRLNKIIAVTRVKTTGDLRGCKIFISVMGDRNDKESVLAALNKSKGFLRSRLAERVNLRLTPEITIVLDDSLDENIRMSKILDGLK